jgi:hypothetical protein
MFLRMLDPFPFNDSLMNFDPVNLVALLKHFFLESFFFFFPSFDIISDSFRLVAVQIYYVVLILLFYEGDFLFADALFLIFFWILL